MSESDTLQTPKPSAGDAIHAVTRLALGTIPALGAPAAELFNWFIKSPIERRRDDWMRQVGECLERLRKDHKSDVAALQNDDAFIDIVMQATHIAMRNSHEERRCALRNAIVNSALPGSPDDAQRKMFLNLIDQFTEWHLRLMTLFNEPARWFEAAGKPFPALSMGALSSIVEAAYPALAGKRELYDQVWRELYATGLVNTDSLHVTMSAGGMQASRCTDRGAAFLRFITEPDKRD